MPNDNGTVRDDFLAEARKKLASAAEAKPTVEAPAVSNTDQERTAMDKFLWGNRRPRKQPKQPRQRRWYHGLWWKIPTALVGGSFAIVIVGAAYQIYYESHYLTPVEQAALAAKRKEQRAQKLADAEAAKSRQAAAALEAAQQAMTCSDDWRKCIDNAEIVQKYDRTAHMQNRCKAAAEQQAQYQTEWPWTYFTKVVQGTTGPTYGEIELIERDAKFQNGFGAMRKVSILCQYDLKTERVMQLNVR